MKHLLLLSSAMVIGSGAASAADFPIYVPPAAPAVHDWSGFYAGINGGYAGGNFEHPFGLDLIVPEGAEEAPEEFLGFLEETLPLGIGAGFEPDDIVDGAVLPIVAGGADLTAGGFIGGVQAGYNLMATESILLGIEADIQGSAVRGEVSADITTPAPGTEIFSAGTSLDWYGTLRARAGMTHDRFLGYVTGGLAYGQTTSSVSVLGGLFEGSEETTRWGWTVGAGVEYAVTEQISLKTEYLYTDLGTDELIGGTLFPLGEGGEGGLGGSLSSSVAFHTVRAGLNFHF
ncbi:MAG: outer membrane protein [Devosia sp.]